ncbi:MAG: Flp family type IVb pilin [Sedimentibacter sp.]|nr:Flp family type IVb pilin [Sedimentibacter sp.]HOA20788.1 Flp family type IVb pilin [Sedimentibacter sp.]
MKKIFSWLRNEESGQGMVEYGLILALIAVVVIVALQTLGSATGEKLEEVGAAISGTSTP